MAKIKGTVTKQQKGQHGPAMTMGDPSARSQRENMFPMRLEQKQKQVLISHGFPCSATWRSQRVETAYLHTENNTWASIFSWRISLTWRFGTWTYCFFPRRVGVPDGCCCCCLDVERLVLFVLVGDNMTTSLLLVVEDAVSRICRTCPSLVVTSTLLLFR